MQWVYRCESIADQSICGGRDLLIIARGPSRDLYVGQACLSSGKRIDSRLCRGTYGPRQSLPGESVFLGSKLVEHLYTYIDPPSERDLGRAVRILAAGGVIAYPTDVNWAFGCDAADVRALDRIKMLKPGHPKEQPFSLICSSISMATQVANIDHSAYRFLKKAWPGPYTVLLTRSRSLPRQIKDKRPIVGVRIPDSPLVLALVDYYGKPLATTSVPVVHGEVLRAGYQVAEQFGHGLDLVLDLGQEMVGAESTIIDLSSGAPLLVRLGDGDPVLFGL